MNRIKTSLRGKIVPFKCNKHPEKTGILRIHGTQVYLECDSDCGDCPWPYDINPSLRRLPISPEELERLKKEIGSE